MRSLSAWLKSIQGRRFGLKTSGNPAAQRAEWVQRLGFQTTVISPFVYSLISDILSGVYPTAPTERPVRLCRRDIWSIIAKCA